MKSSLVLPLLIFSYFGSSQKILIHGEETDRKLNWADFTGKVDRNSPFVAYTGYQITFKAENIQAFGDSLSIGKFEVTLALDPVKSWVNMAKATDELLVHEQKHFDIGIICMREILAVYAKTKFTKYNFNETIQGIITSTRTKYHDMGLKYDEESDHSKNKEQQAKWNMFIAAELEK